VRPGGYALWCYSYLYTIILRIVIRAVLFDIDGVLLDSFEAGMHFLRDILGDLGYPKPPRSRHKKAFHLPLIPALSYLAKAELTEEAERIHEVIPTIQYHSELLSEPEDTEKTLGELSHTYKLGIVTSRNNDGLYKRYFDLFPRKKYFATCITAENCLYHKPHPGPLLLAAKRLKLRPHECVYVGDSLSDVEAAKAAGMKVILYGGRTHSDADAHTRAFKKLPEVIARW